MPTAAGEYRTPLLSLPELAERAQSACEHARKSGRAVLIEFSAPWCQDCVRLERLKSASPLREELAGWELLSINVGDGFQHPELMRAFRVQAIAKWVVSKPKNCALPLRHWPIQSARTLEHLHADPELAGRALLRWLGGARKRLRAR